MSSVAEKNKKTLKRLLLLVALMFAFAFALIPLYNVMCKTLGLNGKPDLTALKEITGQTEDTSRDVLVEFDVTHHQHMPWEFYPLHKRVPLHPGGVIHTAYYARNLTDQPMTMQAIPSITPGKAAKYVRKLECFCFTHQTLQPGESAELPLTFILESEVPKDVNTMTLSYTLFDVTDHTKN